MEPTLFPGNLEQPRASRNLRILLWLLILAAATEFVVRGPARFLQPIDWNDLAQNYAASRLWLRGQNPSNAANFVALWLQEVHSQIEVNSVRTHLAPPLGSLVLLAPIAALPWPAAKIAWTGVLVLAFLLTVLTLVRTAGFRLNEPRTLAFVAGCFALAPFHTGMATGNVSIVVIAACAMGIWAASRGRDVTAGALFAVACSFKPHIGAFFVLYYLVRRRWQVFGSALAFTAGLVLIAALWMQLCGVSWAHDYFRNAKGFVTANRIDDFTSANPIRFMLINLQVPFYSFTGNSALSNLLALSAGVLLVAVWLYWIIRNQEHGSELLALGAIALICLMPVYHRFYDAAVLVIPLCWCLSRPPGKLKGIAGTALLLMAPFLVPGTAILQQAALHGRVPDAVIQSWWWTRVVMPHEAWTLLLLCLVLLCGMALEQRTLARSVP
jgi:hypothetical protein